MTGAGRFLPIGIFSLDRPQLGESRHSSKEFICSVRPSLNDRSRLGAAGQIIELRQAENDPKQTWSVANLHQKWSLGLLSLIAPNFR